MKKRNYLWGIIFVVAAVMILFNEMSIFEHFGVWKIIITLLLVSWLVDGLKKRDWGGILFPAAFLCIAYDDLPFFESITPWPVLGAALFGSIGLGMMFGNKKGNNINNRKKITEAAYSHEDIEEVGVDDEFVLDTSFKSTNKYVKADNFKKASISCSFGDAKIYFDDAVINCDEAVINVDVKFGNVCLFVPKNWYVTNEAVAVFGSVEEKNKSVTTGRPKVRIEGNVSFGDVSVTYC